MKRFSMNTFHHLVGFFSELFSTIGNDSGCTGDLVHPIKQALCEAIGKESKGERMLSREELLSQDEGCHVGAPERSRT